MSTRIRLRRMGSNKRPFFRVVVADQRSPRDGRFIENIGKYHPLADPSVIDIDQERALHWLRVGAQPSNQVRVLMQKVGIWEEFAKERPSAAATPKERTPKERVSKKAKQKAESEAVPAEVAAADVPAPAAEVPPESPEPQPPAAHEEPTEASSAEAEVAEASAAEAVEAAPDAAPATEDADPE